MRNISFSLTKEAIYSRTKTVTRRLGWALLKPGDHLIAIEKGQGLKKGEKVKRICEIEVVSVAWETLRSITPSECDLEGFPGMNPGEFVEMFCTANQCDPTVLVRRIEFKYV